MPFKFGGPDMPMSLRWTRSLVYSEVVLLAFAVISYVVFSVLGLSTTSGSGSATTTTNTSASTVVLLIVISVIALVLGYLAVDLRNKRNMTRVAITVIQVAILVFGVATSLGNPVSIALVVVLAVGTIYSLYAPSSNAAFAESTGTEGARPEPELPEELKKIFAEAKAKKDEAGDTAGPVSEEHPEPDTDEKESSS